ANIEGQLIEHRLYQEVVRLPFSSESQGVISKNSFSCLMTIVTCDRELAGEQRLFKKKNCELSQFFF
ncbi:TPA: hypothetical protein QFK55_002399, partial [Enterococcus faecium]